MGLVRINQLLGKIETTEGTAATLTTAEFIDALNLSRTPTQDIEDQVVSGGSLSEDLGIVGRGSLGLSFSTRYYGLIGTSGIVDPPLATGILPLDDPLLRACGLRVTTIPYLKVSVAPTIATFAGMTLTDSSGGTAVLAAPIVNGRCYYTGIGGTGTFPNADTTLEVNGNGFTVSSATSDGSCWAYLPDSQPTALVTLTGAGWTGAGTPIVGDVVENTLNGVDAARGIVVSLSGTLLEIEPILPGRAFLAGETVRGTTGGRTSTNTVAGAGQVLNRVPSMTLKANVGRHSLTGVGMRGNMTLALEAGKIPLANYEFSGSYSSSASEAPLAGVATVSPSSIARWQSAIVNVDGFEIPVSVASLSLGNTVSLLPDAHGTNGVRGSAITARQPTLTCNFQRVDNGVYNFDSRIRNATTISFYTQWGTQAGLRNAIWLPRCQLYSISDGDAEGTLTAEVTLRPKRRTGSGDDEIYLMFGLQ